MVESNAELSTRIDIKDITEHKKAEHELFDSQMMLRSVFDASPPLLVIDLNGKILDCNKQAQEIFGYSSKSELVKRSALESIAEEDLQRAMENMEKTLKQGLMRNIEYTIIAKDKSKHAVSVNASVLRDASGNPVGFVSAIEDITERKKAEWALKESEEKFQNIFESVADGLIYLDRSGKILDVNRKAVEIFGGSKEELLGKRFTKIGIFSFREIPALMRNFASMLRGKKVTVNVTFKNKDEQVISLECSSSLMKAGNKSMIAVVARDVTERKRADGALQESEERYRLLFEQSPIAISITAPDGKFIDTNKAVQKIFGYSEEEFKKINVADLYEKPKHRNALLEAIKQHGAVADFSAGLKRKDGTSIEALLNVSRVHIGGNSFLQTTVQDITERKRAEKRIRESEEKFRTLAEESPDMIFVNAKDRVVYANRKSEELMGYTREEFYSRDFNFLCLIAPEFRELIKEVYEKHMKGEEPPLLEYRLVTKDGRILDAILESKLVTYEGERAILGTVTDITVLKKAEKALRQSEEKFKSLFTRSPEAMAHVGPRFEILEINPRFTELFGYTREEAEGKNLDSLIVPTDKIAEAEELDKRAIEGYLYHDTTRKTKNGSFVPVSVSAAPIGVQGTLTGYVAVYKDISSLKRTEEELSIMNEKLRVISGLTRHDARNRLTLVTTNAYLAKECLHGNNEAEDYLEKIEAAVNDVVGIFDFAKIYEMLGAEKPTYIDVEKAVNEAVSLFPALKTVKVVNDCHGLTVLADSLLRQAFYNLIDDSLKYAAESHPDKNIL